MFTLTSPILSIPTLILWSYIINRIIFYALRIPIHSLLSKQHSSIIDHVIGIIIDTVEAIITLPITYLLTVGLLTIATSTDFTSMFGVLKESLSEHSISVMLQAIPTLLLANLLTKCKNVIFDVLYKVIKNRNPIIDFVFGSLEAIAQYPIETAKIRALVNSHYQHTLRFHEIWTMDMFNVHGVMMYWIIHVLQQLAEFGAYKLLG
jgi:hypothetical protein